MRILIFVIKISTIWHYLDLNDICFLVWTRSSLPASTSGGSGIMHPHPAHFRPGPCAGRCGGRRIRTGGGPRPAATRPRAPPTRISRSCRPAAPVVHVPQGAAAPFSVPGTACPSQASRGAPMPRLRHTPRLEFPDPSIPAARLPRAGRRRQAPGAVSSPARSICIEIFHSYTDDLHLTKL